MGISLFPPLILSLKTMQAQISPLSAGVSHNAQPKLRGSPLLPVTGHRFLTSFEKDAAGIESLD